MASRLVVGFLVWVFLRVSFGDLEEVGDVVECARVSLELCDQGLVAARGLEAMDRGVRVDADRVVLEFLPPLDPVAGRLAGSLDASLQVLDGGGAGVGALEVPDEGISHLFPGVDAILWKGVDPLPARSLHHQGEVASGEQVGVASDSHRHEVRV